MSGVLVDSSVLLDILHDDPKWGGWSRTTLSAVSATDQLVINSIIYAEIAPKFATRAELDAALPTSVIRREPFPFNAAYTAGRAFSAYRRRGGTRTAILADFLIGAHAEVGGYRLLTRDTARFKTAYPQLPLIAPPGLAR